MTLYEIDAAITEAIQAAMDPDTGELIEGEAFERLNHLEMARDQKVENIGCLMKEYKAEAEAIKAEKQALARRQAVAENKAESLKNYLTYALQGEKFKSPKLAVSYRTSKAVEVYDEAEAIKAIEQMPETMQADLMKVEKSLRKDNLKTYLIDHELGGVQVIERTSTIVK